MRIYSVMPNYQAKSIKRNDRVQSNNQSTPVAMSINPQRTMPGVLLTFTGNNEKHINEFASYAPENKRFGYMAGGLGVVTQEAPDNWRLREKADVRDFSPYHAYDNGDGGIKAVIVKKDAKGNYITNYDANEFYHANPNETLEQLMKRENIQLKDGEEFRFVVQRKPNDKGISSVIVLEEATDLKGSVTRPSTKSISEMETVIAFWRAVEDAYEAGIGRQVFLDRYRDFKTVVPSKMGEKQLWRQFAQASGYEAYPVLKRARESQAKFIKMVGDEK